MYQLLFRILILIFASVNFSCSQSDESAQEQASVKPQQKIPFVAPRDSTLTLTQLKAWRRCNRSLDSLAFLYQDSFSLEDPRLFGSRQRSFTRSQDTICVRNGLMGGYDEYLWILNNAGSIKNRSLLDSPETKTH